MLYLLTRMQGVVQPVHLNGEGLALMLVEESHHVVPVDQVIRASDWYRD